MRTLSRRTFAVGCIATPAIGLAPAAASICKAAPYLPPPSKDGEFLCLFRAMGDDRRRRIVMDLLRDLVARPSGSDNQDLFDEASSKLAALSA